MYEDLYAELLNKIRWAVASSVGTFSNVTHRESQAIARPFASLIVEAVKAQGEKPDLVMSLYIDQQMGAKALDKIEA